MTNRLTPEALDALLAEHHEVEGMCISCSDANMGGWTKRVHFPCTIYLLASEVRDARPVIEAARAVDEATRSTRGAELSPLLRKMAGALAHYEEGAK